MQHSAQQRRRNPMANSTVFRLLMSPLTRTIYAGRVKQMDATTAVSTGVRHDVTNDFLGVVIQYGEALKGKFEIVSGDDAWDVTVTKRAQAQEGE
jgi:hypothetical protein